MALDACSHLGAGPLALSCPSGYLADEQPLQTLPLLQSSLG